jgi:hypothetical protein
VDKFRTEGGDTLGEAREGKRELVDDAAIRPPRGKNLVEYGTSDLREVRAGVELIPWNMMISGEGRETKK